MLALNSFNPINTWREVAGSGTFSDGRPVLIEDGHGERYLNATNGALRRHCVVNFVLAPGYALLATIGNVFKVVSLYNFWGEPLRGRPGKEKCIATAKDIARIALAPIALLGMELASIWGLMSPRDGRKVLRNTMLLLTSDTNAIEQERLFEALNLAEKLKAEESVDAQVREQLTIFCEGLYWHWPTHNWSRELVEQSICDYHADARIVSPEETP